MYASFNLTQSPANCLKATKITLINEVFQVNLCDCSTNISKTSMVLSLRQGIFITCRNKGEYDALLEELDVLIMSTFPNLPCRIPSRYASIKEKLAKAEDMLSNMAIFDVTGHPALTINCGIIMSFQ